MFKSLRLLKLFFITAVGIKALKTVFNVPLLSAITLEQGNVLSLGKIAQLKKGMSPQQVIELLGEPLIQSTLIPTRWNYIHFFAEKTFLSDFNRLTIQFDQNLTRLIELDFSKELALALKETTLENGLSKDVKEAVEKTLSHTMPSV